jgi:hypothetical protein
MPWIFIAFKNPSSSAEYELVKLGSSGKHENHCTTKGDKPKLKLSDDLKF